MAVIVKAQVCDYREKENTPNRLGVAILNDGEVVAIVTKHGDVLEDVWSYNLRPDIGAFTYKPSWIGGDLE